MDLGVLEGQTKGDYFLDSIFDPSVKQCTAPPGHKRQQASPQGQPGGEQEQLVQPGGGPFWGFKIPPPPQVSLEHSSRPAGVEYTILSHFSHPHSIWVLKDDECLM